MKSKLSLLFALISMTAAAQKPIFKISENAYPINAGTYDHTDTIKGTLTYKVKEGDIQSIAAVRYDLVYNEKWMIRGADSVWKQFGTQVVRTSSVSTDNPYAITGWYRFDPLPFNEQSATTQERRAKNSIKQTIMLDRNRKKDGDEGDADNNLIIPSVKNQHK